MGKGNGVQHLMDDGIGIWGRLTGFIAAFCLICLTVSFFTPTWSSTTAFSMGGGLNAVSEATFGLREYCLKSRTSTFVEDQFLCFEYEDMLEVKNRSSNADAIDLMYRGADGTSAICGAQKIAYLAAAESGLLDLGGSSWVNQTGCDRFDDACDNSVIRILLTSSILAVVCGAMYSEKIPFFGAMLLVAMILGIAAIGVWNEWIQGLDSEFEPDIGLAIMATAVSMAFLGAILAAIDTCVGASRSGLFEDGIDLFGRMGSLLTVATWLFFAIAMVMPTWTEVSDLGRAGNLCNDDCLDAECTGIRATFGLLRYCMETAADLNGGAKKELVCMFYSEEVQIVGRAESINAFDRFESVDLKQSVEWTTIALSVGIGCAAFADIFSEKLLPSAILSAMSGAAGVVALSFWLALQTKLDDEVAGSAESSDGVYVVATAFCISFFTMIVYGVNACKAAKKGSSEA